MTHSQYFIRISKIISFFIMIALSLCFLLIGLYLILVEDPQTYTRWHTEQAISHITIASHNQNSQIALSHIRAAHEIGLQALLIFPYDAHLWLRLARIESLLSHHEIQNINQALDIAVQLQPSLRLKIQQEGIMNYE